MKFKAFFSAAASALLCYLQSIFIPLIILIIVMIADYISGMIKAYIKGELSSKVGKIGILRKLSYFLVIITAAVCDWLIYKGLRLVNVEIQLSYYLGVLVTVWLIINELISILENLGAVGVPLPGFLQKLIKRLKQTVDKEEEYAEG